MNDLLLRIDESLVPGNECNSEDLLRESSEEICAGRHIIRTLEKKVGVLEWDVEDLEFDLSTQKEEIDRLKNELNSKRLLSNKDIEELDVMLESKISRMVSGEYGSSDEDLDIDEWVDHLKRIKEKLNKMRY